MKKPSSRLIQALLTISVLALTAFVLMAVIIPLITDYFLRDKDPAANDVRPAPVVVVTPVKTTTPITATTSTMKVDVDQPTERMTNSTAETEPDQEGTETSTTSAATTAGSSPANQ